MQAQVNPEVQPTPTAWHQLHHEDGQSCGGCENSWKSKSSWTNKIQIFLLVLAAGRDADVSAVSVRPSCCSIPHTSFLGCVDSARNSWVPFTGSHPVGVAYLEFNFLLVLKPAHSYVGRSHLLPETSCSTNNNNAEI